MYLPKVKYLQRTFRGVLSLASHQHQVNSRNLPTRLSHSSCQTDAEFDARYEAYFNRPDIDCWEARKAMNELFGYDLVPEPKIIVAALRACRRLNDYALAIRFLEAVKNRCGNKVQEIYPYLLQEIRPTLCDLGIETPEELGYDKPELALKTVYDMEEW
ncbi:cytochrome c oxidase subunit 5A, mitochondrial-like [Malaya genurostris]|uniref:cytochrome c oxidase subunit 5A, mitochondrial-like n=1 Tax=Malaya genurostris TaxID=325434 RepID=UPI0026F3CB6D|nr:cytochrome c oxidase subunit 5A, mitochondrial-like [Malaya genurostris]